MKKHITITGIIFMTVFFVLPMTAFGRGARTGNHPAKMMAVMAPQTQMQSTALTVEQINRIEDLQKKIMDDNADTLKQLMAKIQKEISDLGTELSMKRIDLYTEAPEINPNA